ncbi:hypothetical protein Sf101_0041 [Enterobacteria phage Sf101]|uniref:hypothetical protein n=1 Tax=Enterobacteria phage Sf101 TaxID=1524881 RepID=UPI0004F88500|nr:hypothetical protein ACQ51_gp41 [Enterobacteria phage Sf101]AII27865.1 hypothetical protein Sf101_0041 [Enterobacteria phage Sf101]
MIRFGYSTELNAVKPLKTFPLLHIPALKKGITRNKSLWFCVSLRSQLYLIIKEIIYGYYCN